MAREEAGGLWRGRQRWCPTEQGPTGGRHRSGEPPCISTVCHHKERVDRAHRVKGWWKPRDAQAELTTADRGGSWQRPRWVPDTRAPIVMLSDEHSLR